MTFMIRWFVFLGGRMGLYEIWWLRCDVTEWWLVGVVATRRQNFELVKYIQYIYIHILIFLENRTVPTLTWYVKNCMCRCPWPQAALIRPRDHQLLLLAIVLSAKLQSISPSCCEYIFLQKISYPGNGSSFVDFLFGALPNRKWVKFLPAIKWIRPPYPLCNGVNWPAFHSLGEPTNTFVEFWGFPSQVFVISPVFPGAPKATGATSSNCWGVFLHVTKTWGFLQKIGIEEVNVGLHNLTAAKNGSDQSYPFILRIFLGKKSSFHMWGSNRNRSIPISLPWVSQNNSWSTVGCGYSSHMAQIPWHDR